MDPHKTNASHAMEHSSLLIVDVSSFAHSISTKIQQGTAIGATQAACNVQVQPNSNAKHAHKVITSTDPLVSHTHAPGPLMQ